MEVFLQNRQQLEAELAGVMTVVLRMEDCLQQKEHGLPETDEADGGR